METALAVTTNKVVTLREGNALSPLLNEPERVAQEICNLHGELAACVKVGLEKALRIGELLTEQKVKLGHGYFTAWVSQCLPFTDRTARNYMRLYTNKDKLKTETVSVLTDAYKLISAKHCHAECNRPLDTYNAAIEQWLIVHGTDLEDKPDAIYHERQEKALALSKISLTEIQKYLEDIETKSDSTVLIGEYAWVDRTLLRLQNHIAEENIRIARHIGELINNVRDTATQVWGRKIGDAIAEFVARCPDEAVEVCNKRIAELEGMAI